MEFEQTTVGNPTYEGSYSQESSGTTSLRTELALGVGVPLVANVPSGAGWLSWTGLIGRASFAMLHVIDATLDDPLVGSGTVHSRVGEGHLDASSRYEEPSFVEMLAQIRSRFGLNMSNFAEVLRVGRPTVYAWIRQEQVPHAARRQRVRRLWELAKTWGEITAHPLGADYDRRVTPDDYTVGDLLSSEQLRGFVLEDILTRLAREKEAQEGEAPLGDRLAAKRGVGHKPYADADRDFLTGRRSMPE